MGGGQVEKTRAREISSPSVGVARFTGKIGYKVAVARSTDRASLDYYIETGALIETPMFVYEKQTGRTLWK